MRKKVEQLKISYFRDLVDSCPIYKIGTWKTPEGPKTYIWRNLNGSKADCHRVTSKRGQELLKLMQERNNNIRILNLLESEWTAKYRAPCTSLKIKRYGYTENRRWFDELGQQQNTYKSSTPIYYKGVEFKSKLEEDFAKLMDEYGILYKYEPRIWVGDNTSKNPDFVIYLPWIDLIIMVEIFGKCGDKEYLYDNRNKVYEYMAAGWTPGFDMLCFAYNEKTPYIRDIIMEEIKTIEQRKLTILSYAA